MTRTVEELQQQAVRLRGYLNYFKERMEGFLSTLNRTNRDITLLLAPESKQLSIEEVRNTLKNCQSRIEAVTSAKPGVRMDVEAVEASPELLDAHAVVMYFPTKADADEVIATIKMAKPGMRSVDITS